MAGTDNPPTPTNEQLHGMLEALTRRVEDMDADHTEKINTLTERAAAKNVCIHNGKAYSEGSIVDGKECVCSGSGDNVSCYWQR